MTTKSIACWARNTVDAFVNFRKMHELDALIIFEKESVTTVDTNGEVLITNTSSHAQQESDSN